MVAKKITRTITIILVICLLLGGTATGFYFGMSYVMSQSARFDMLEERFREARETGISLIDENTPGAVMLIIPRAANSQKIAEILSEKGVIENPFLFTLLSRFNGFDDTYRAGTHFVSPEMNYDEIMFLLSQNPRSVRVTFPEGITYREVKVRLRAAGVNFDEEVLDNMVRNPQMFLEYRFITDIEIKEGRDWLLQGYLYPDTYAFDVNTDEETILRTFLNNTRNKLLDEYYERAAIMGMTMDEVITLASIIQNESVKIEEMRTVSGVFVNRLRRGEIPGVWMPLESCATVNYLRTEAGLRPVLWVTDNDVTFDSPYNTYNYEGLPPGPISSPGENAIRAALWPERHDYYFFVADGAGNNVFARTLAEQERNIRRFNPNA